VFTCYTSCCGCAVCSCFAPAYIAADLLYLGLWLATGFHCCLNSPCAVRDVDGGEFTDILWEFCGGCCKVEDETTAACPDGICGCLGSVSSAGTAATEGLRDQLLAEGEYVDPRAPVLIHIPRERLSTNTGTVTEESGTSGSGLHESLVGATEQKSRVTCEDCEEDLATHRCVDCQQVLCDACTKRHQKMKKTKSHTVNPLANSAPPPAHECKFTYPFDENGVLYYIGTNSNTQPYKNPHIHRWYGDKDAGAVAVAVIATDITIIELKEFYAMHDAPQDEFLQIPGEGLPMNDSFEEFLQYHGSVRVEEMLMEEYGENCRDMRELEGAMVVEEGLTGEVVAKMSSTWDYSGGPYNLVQHPHDGYTEVYTHEDDGPHRPGGSYPWMSIDLGKGRSLVPSYYCLRHGDKTGRKHGNFRLRSWDFEGSNDGINYTVIREHKNDDSMSNEGFGVTAWEVEAVNQAFRHFRIRMTGMNWWIKKFPKYTANGCPAACLRCAGIELYGLLLSR
jgi:hypothetical protein